MLFSQVLEKSIHVTMWGIEPAERYNNCTYQIMDVLANLSLAGLAINQQETWHMRETDGHTKATRFREKSIAISHSGFETK